MRRVDKIITSEREIKAIVDKAAVCRIALVDDNNPYIFPVHFVVRDKNLYFHSAPEGRKIDILHRNNSVCFEIDADVETISGDSPCSWGTKYRSIIGFGKAFFLEGQAEKKKVLDYLMCKYSGRNSFSYKEDILEKVVVIGVKIEEISGKKSGY